MSAASSPSASLVARVLEGDPRAIARAITWIESDLPEAADLVRGLFERTGRAYLVGVTGPPGAGKSTLVDRLTALLRQAGETVGVVAVDPTSPFSGGAVLGDRVRMQAHAGDSGVFIRSMATRGHLGGLARATGEAALVLDAAGKDVILIETVGVGQDEIEIVRTADVSIVTLVPGTGDEIQALKAGIMEIADIFVVNKADRADAGRAYSEILMVLEMSDRRDGYTPPVLRTVATTGEGVEELAQAILDHHRYLEAAGLLVRKARERIVAEVMEIINRQVGDTVARALQQDPEMIELMHKLVDTREIDPRAGARLVIRHLLRKE